MIIASANIQNTAPKSLPVNSETLKTSDITEQPVRALLVTQIRNCFEKSADAQGQHMTVISSQISKNVIDAMSNSDNPRIVKEEGTKECSHSTRAKASDEDEEHSRRKHQKLRNNSFRDKSQKQEKER